LAGENTPPSRTLKAGWNLIGYYQREANTTALVTNALKTLKSQTLYDKLKALTPPGLYGSWHPASGVYPAWLWSDRLKARARGFLNARLNRELPAPALGGRLACDKGMFPFTKASFCRRETLF